MIISLRLFLQAYMNVVCSGRPIRDFWVSADTDIIGRSPIPIPIFIGRYLPTKTWIFTPLFKPFFFNLLYLVLKIELWEWTHVSNDTFKKSDEWIGPCQTSFHSYLVLRGNLSLIAELKHFVDIIFWLQFSKTISVHIFHYIYFWISIKNMSK